MVAFLFIRTFEKSEPFHFEYSSTIYPVRKGSDLLLLSGDQRLKTTVIVVFPFGIYSGIVFIF